MQKDFHFYLTYALSRKVGICAEEAEKIAWADQQTDELTEAELYGVQTQSKKLGNWGDRQIQLSVLVPFHFLPGDDENKPWMVTANSHRARALVEAAENPFELGIALHTLQDTFSHQGFSGWQERANACFPWWYLQSAIPNVGHAEMGVVPDVANYVWTDPRTGELIDNKVRAFSCAAATYGILHNFAEWKNHNWPTIAEELETIFRMNYDDRKCQLRALGGNHTISYKNLDGILRNKYKKDFVQVARKQLATVMKSLSNSPPEGTQV